ncbi:MAG TPA: IS630 family transposase [Thermoanaerobaculia bacterium]|nr:IS630 family transposase [Thermoanaerobaculia bacterium]
MRVAIPVVLTEEELTILTRWSRGRSTPARLVLRARIVLRAAEGLSNRTIAEVLDTDRECVGRWRKRFAEQRLEGIERDAPRGGRKKSLPAATVRKVIRLATTATPSNATHWSTRSLARAVGISFKSVHRILQSQELKPHLVRRFKISNDPLFVEKVTDIIGLYLNPPEQALVLCADEKSQIQALDRTQRPLPLKKGQAKTATHDYRRNGTTTLFAAIELLTGNVVSRCMPRHRHQEWLKFLRQIDAEMPPELDLHLIVDNYATHKHPAVKRWVANHPRFHMHFTPTSASWLNLIERFFGELTDKRIRRGTFRSVPELIKAIDDYIAHHNDFPSTFTWTAKVEDVLSKVERARKVLNKTASE